MITQDMERIAADIIRESIADIECSYVYEHEELDDSDEETWEAIYSLIQGANVGIYFDGNKSPR